MINTIIYPNPGNGTFTINPNWNEDQLALLILDASGREIYRNTLDGHVLSRIEIQAFPGVYLLLLTDGMVTIKRKLFIQ
jgi:hypothetical protein